MNRRQFMHASTGVAALAVSACSPRSSEMPAAASRVNPDLRQHIASQMGVEHIPGLCARVIDSDRVLWQGDFGFADLVSRAPITDRHTQNIASVSKTFTAVAVLQQVEKGVLDLDADIGSYLPFPIRNPSAPGVAITIRMLMNHRSSLRDGPNYDANYHCGDPSMALADWVRANFSTEGDLYDPDGNFENRRPGDEYSYCNTAYGVLGYLAEIASGTEFAAYCRDRLFKPLGMTSTSWMIADLASQPTTTPYSWIDGGALRGTQWPGLSRVVIDVAGNEVVGEGASGFAANCLYNHPNYPDGFLRTSIHDMTSWARLWLGDGELGGSRILQPETTRQMLTPEPSDEDELSGNGLTWAYERDAKRTIWGHNGSDPGVDTSLKLDRQRGVAAIVFANTDSVDTDSIARLLLQEVER